ncbi:hypothetical protein GO730_26555 [Spirosoma sp. HMF3257]|uniref:Putative HNH nuclease YajD n=1 Tax=Spirosoma telluris TaxID=2183553 RepID=A0A327NQ45_9BACT|nr:hypothetical protein [Spirosoma telluris]RAI76833.1 hypothetical protein HMF3257_26485 [Spirosoma telluris]
MRKTQLFQLLAMPTIHKVKRPWVIQATKSNSRICQPLNGNIPTNFYRMADWRKLRERVLEKQPLCVHCKEKQRITLAQMVDHIKPIRSGGEPLDEANLMPLCHHCHQIKRGKERHQ